MNVSKLANSYIFKDNNDNLFKIQSYECGLSKKISDLLKFDSENYTARFCNKFILCVGHGSMIIWKYNLNQKNSISTFIEYHLPNCTSGHNAKQCLKIAEFECVFVSNDGLVRYWPKSDLPMEYIDHQISIISNDECLLVEKVDDRVLVAVFRSMKIAVIDLRDWSEIGISAKLFTQPRSFINGFGRYLSSFIVNSASGINTFKNIKVNNLLQEETELLVMTDNNIDSLILDVLLNGQYKREILEHESLKKSIFDNIYKDSGIDYAQINIIFENFDLCHNILYLLVQVQSKEWSNFLLLTYNRKSAIVDSVVEIEVSLSGQTELHVIVDDSAENDEPCLLAAVRDCHNVYLVEVLTGTVKCHLKTESGSSDNSRVKKDDLSVVAWFCPTMFESPNTTVITFTSNKQLVTIKQNINPIINQSFSTRHNSELDFNLSNASFIGDSNQRNSKPPSLRGDVSFASFNQSSFIRPSALSTPLSKFDHKGDRLRDTLNTSLNRSVTNTSLTVDIDKLCTDTSVFGTFRKSVVLYWQGYKSQSKRVVSPIIERARVNSDISIPMFVLQIAREIIDEYPSKDPRWTKIISSTESTGLFFYSNKSLLLPQQLQSKKDALQKLVMMLKENDIDIFGRGGNTAPMTVCQSLYMQIHPSSLPLFGASQVTWPVAHCVGFGMELLEFVKNLNEILSGENCEEIHGILTECCQHVMAIEKKLSPLEVVSQEVSLVPRFIRHCAEYLNEKRSAIESKRSLINDDVIYTQLGKILSSCLRSSLICRQKFEDTFLSVYLKIETYSQSAAAACWMTENQPLGVLDSLIDMIRCLLEHSRTVDYRVLESTVEIVTVLLDTFRHRIDWMAGWSANDAEARRLEEAYADTRADLIRRIVEDDRNIELGLELADRFCDFQWLTSICETIDNQPNKEKASDANCHIEPYLRKYSSQGLAEFVLDWYQDRLKEVVDRNQGTLLAKIQRILDHIQKIECTNNVSGARLDSSTGSQLIGRFLDRVEVQTTRWLHEVETGEFREAGFTLARLAETEQASVARKARLLGLAKLSMLASGEDYDDVGAEIDGALKMVKCQREVPTEVVERVLGLPGNRQPVIKTHQVARLHLAAAAAAAEAAESDKAQWHLVKALEILALCCQRPKIAGMTSDEWRQLQLVVWDEIVRRDDWTNKADDKSIRDCVTYGVFAAAADTGLPMDLLLPSMDELFEYARDQGRVYSTEVEFLVRRTFEVVEREAGIDGMELDDDDDEGILQEDDLHEMSCS